MSRAANPTGAVTFTCDGVDYTLLFTIDTICRLESKLDQGITEIIGRIQTKPTMTLLRAVLHAGLAGQHPTLTEIEAGELFRSYGAEGLGEKLTKAFEAAFGIAETEEGAAKADPLTAAPTA